MAEEKTNGEEIYGGADGALERAEKSMKARREFIKKAMEPAEKAKKDVVKATATDEVRLQGTKETTAPKSLKPYVERINVVDRKALSALIEAAKEEGREWKVSRCLKEGYRYTFMTMRNATKLNEKEDLGAKKEKEAEAPKKETKKKADAPADVTGLELTAVPAEDLPMPDDADVAGAEPEHVLTAMDVIRSMFDISVTEDGRLSICAIPEGEPKEGEEPACVVSSRPITEDEQAAIGILPGEGEDVAEISDAHAEKMDAPLDEASSAEKRAYRNGGEDAEDLYYGRVIARIKDKALRDKVAKSYSGERGEKPRADAKTLMRKASDEEEAKFAKKQQKMQDKGYHEEDGYDMDEIEAPVEPKLSRKCPKCGKVDLNDAGECPLCDLGDESVLDDENESLRLREGKAKSIPNGKASIVIDYGRGWDYDDAPGCFHDEPVVDDTDEAIKKAISTLKDKISAHAKAHPAAYKEITGCDFGVKRPDAEDSANPIDYVDSMDISARNRPELSEARKEAIHNGKFIKTINSPIDAVDLIDELEMHDIDAAPADNGVMVPEEDYDEAIDVLMQMETREAGERKPCKRGIGREINPNYDSERDGCDGLYESSELNEDAPVEGVDVRLDDLDHFKPVAGARETWDAIAKEGKIKELAGILSDFAKDGKMTATDLNDMLWFERDWVFGRLGINGVDADDAFDVDAEEI